jgi:hypothetical protein
MGAKPEALAKRYAGETVATASLRSRASGPTVEAKLDPRFRGDDRSMR